MKKNLLINPSKAALGVLGAAFMPVAASAQQADAGVTFSVDGAMGTGNYTNEFYKEKLDANDFDEFDSDSAFVGSVGASGAINDTWDWKLSVSRTEYSSNVLSEVAEDGFGSASNDNSRTDAGLTIGRSVALGPVNTRLGLGLAYANATSSADIGLAYANATSSADKGFTDVPFDSFESETETSFQGIGPRLSIDAETAPISPDGRLSIVGGADVSLLSGQYTYSKGISAYDGEDSFGGSSKDTSDGELTTAGLYVGLKYAASDATSFRFGLRRDVTIMERADRADAEFFFSDDQETLTVRDDLNSVYIGMDIKF
ncbi:hypothetical protein N9E38_02290 [Yoonia sp.]|nr:hypothetical protein [Yoonia sp.]